MQLGVQGPVRPIEMAYADSLLEESAVRSDLRQLGSESYSGRKKLSRSVDKTITDQYAGNIHALRDAMCWRIEPPSRLLRITNPLMTKKSLMPNYATSEQPLEQIDSGRLGRRLPAIEARRDVVIPHHRYSSGESEQVQ